MGVKRKTPEWAWARFLALNDHSDGRRRRKTTKTSLGRTLKLGGVRPPIYERSEIVGHNRRPKTSGPKKSWPKCHALHFTILSIVLEDRGSSFKTRGVPDALKIAVFTCSVASGLATTFPGFWELSKPRKFARGAGA